MPKKIIVLALGNIKNAGDELLGATVTYLAQSVTQNPVEQNQLTFSAIQGIKQYKMWHNVGLFIVLHFVAVLCKKIKLSNLQFQFDKWAYRCKLYTYYNRMMQTASSVIVAGGMLKYSTQNLVYVFDVLTLYANKYNVPVLFNAQSIQAPNEQDSRYQFLVKICNRSCVKMITTRDGQDGLVRLRKYYVKNSEIITDYVGDPALWTPECFGIQKQPSDIIGINVIRHGIYQSYGSDFSDRQLLDVYSQLIKELDARGCKWLLFCNGMVEDVDFGKELLSLYHIPPEKFISAPQNSKELVQILSGFKAVFGARLHACITSFALDIPIVGLLWDDKLKYFAKTMGLTEFFLDTHQLTGQNIVERLNEACKFKIDTQNRNIYKMRTQQLIKNFLLSSCPIKNNL